MKLNAQKYVKKLNTFFYSCAYLVKFSYIWKIIIPSHVVAEAAWGLGVFRPLAPNDSLEPPLKPP